MIFRYPGGKQRLLPVIMAALDPLLRDAPTFTDVFVGGGSVLIAVAERYPSKRLIANDLDLRMAAFWQLVATGTDSDAAAFCKLLRIPVTLEWFNAFRNMTLDTQTMRAYHAVFFNRTTFSGIATAGPIGGQAQASEWKVDCRYNADRLVADFKNLRELFQGRLTVTCADCLKVVSTTSDAMYLDPPYYKQGKNLYPVSMTPAEHSALAKALEDRPRWVMSYDNCPEILDSYSFANIIPVDVRYSINGTDRESWIAAKELLITP
jgi:DNA adenine methylase